MNPTKRDDPSSEVADELAYEALDRAASDQGICIVSALCRAWEE